MAESANSSSVSNAPVFLVSRYARPSWSVQVGGAILEDAILQRVESGFGSDMSSATFILPRSPFTVGLPEQGDAVQIFVNGIVVFRGVISVISKHVGADNMKLTYTCLSRLFDLTHTTVTKGSFNSDNSDWNLDFPGRLFDSKEVINLSVPDFGIASIPELYPGEVNVTDQTKLAAIESVLAKIGNYKLHYDFETDGLSIYKLQTGGTNTRSFIPGKNVVSMDVSSSDENVVDRIDVIGAPTAVKRTIPVNSSNVPIGIGIDKNGRYSLIFQLEGRNIRDVSVEGLANEKPVLEFDNKIFINKAMMSLITFTDYVGAGAGIEGTLTPTVSDDNSDFILRPIILRKQIFLPDWTKLAVDLEYGLTLGTALRIPGATATFLEKRAHGKNLVTVFLSELPKLWFANTLRGVIDTDEQQGSVEILEVPPKDFVFFIGALRVTYTIDGNRPVETVGSGPIVRTITDEQYQIVDDTTSSLNAQSQFELTRQNDDIRAQMLLRAQGEYDRLHFPVISGTITVLGDETVKLRQTILLDGNLLDILHVTHDFTNGFRTEVTLTNERLRITPILSPYRLAPLSNAAFEKDKRRSFQISAVDINRLRTQEQQSKSVQSGHESKTSPSPNSVYKS